ncbi:2424_t:CDS:2 [Funneliformis mosseae]|uniref:2424_t:CDS:1 n=1 Tax=Funneliformis mosseae TaxID=27381 RepID=A0A9N9AGF2_FUNMO|nr:2424_t:CDS:2 [Funneliformis mosseae]
MSRATKTLDNSKKSANKRGEDLIIRRFLSELLRTKSNKQPEDNYNYDPVDDITDSMAGMTLNSATINAIKFAVRSAVKKCTKCEDTIHKVLHNSGSYGDEDSISK